MNRLINALKGFIVKTKEIEETIDALYNFKVPKLWQYYRDFATNTSLVEWIFDFGKRYSQLDNWISKERPQTFWMTGFINPFGFLSCMK